MTSLDEFILSAPTIINSQGEEIWEGYGTNLALVRLQPGTRSEKHYHVKTKEIYGILRGRPTLVLDTETLNLNVGAVITIIPGQVHQIFNKTNEVVLFAVLSHIPWSADDQYLA